MSKHGTDAFVNVSLKGTDCPQKRYWHFYFILPITPDKAAFMSADGTALCTVADGETAMLNPS